MPTPPPDVEALMLDRLRTYADRNPRFNFLLSDLREIAALCHGAIPRRRPPERGPNGSVPLGWRERAAILAPSREAAERTPVRPPAAPNHPLGQSDSSEPLSAREKALQSLLAEPAACAILALVAEGLTDPAISEQLGLTKYQVKERVRRWLNATGSHGRRELAAWAERNGATGAEAAR